MVRPDEELQLTAQIASDAAGLLCSPAALLWCAAGKLQPRWVDLDAELRRHVRPLMNDFANTDDTYVPRTQPSFGRQLLAIYFGSPTCGYCVQAPFIATIKRAGALIQREAAAHGLTMHWSGVAVHWSAREGIEYLSKLGPFDEVCAGAMWWNTSVAHHLYGNRPPAVPTLVVYERTIEANATHALQLRDQHELLRLTGSKAIEEWIAIGAPIDALRSSNLDHGNSAT